jgi:site-specific DNA-methyltransferase (adenine-specific)
MIDLNNKIWHGDCLELMKNIPDKSIDLILTDPPYKMTKRGKSCRPNWMPHSMGENVFDGKIPDTQTWMNECFRVLKNETHFYTFCNTNDLKNYLNCANDAGFKFHNLISMEKDTGMPNRWYLKKTELVLFFRKGKAKPINDMTSTDNVKVIMPKKRDGKLHITEKPLSFITKLVFNSSKVGDLVLDPFAGSGTTGAAAKALGMNYLLIEQDKTYCEVASVRLDQNDV